MGGIGKALAGALASLTLASCASVARAHAQDRFSILKAVAIDIEKLKTDFPQLREFSAIKHLSAEPPSIGYAFRTHAPERTGGWTSGFLIPMSMESGFISTSTIPTRNCSFTPSP